MVHAPLPEDADWDGEAPDQILDLGNMAQLPRRSGL